MTTRDEIMAMDEDALRLAVAKALGWVIIDGNAFVGLKDKSGLSAYEQTPDWPRDKNAAIALLDGMTYPPEPDGRVLHVEYVILKETYHHLDDIDPLDKPRFIVEISSRNPIYGDSHWGTADTLPRAACEAWLMWDDARKEAQHDNS